MAFTPRTLVITSLWEKTGNISLSPKNRYIRPHSHRNQRFKSPSLFHKSHQPTHQPHSNNLTPYFPTLLPRTPQLLTINPSFPLHILHRIRIKPKFLSMRAVRYAAETNAEFRCICAVLFWAWANFVSGKCGVWVRAEERRGWPTVLLPFIFPCQSSFVHVKCQGFHCLVCGY